MRDLLLSTLLIFVFYYLFHYTVVQQVFPEPDITYSLGNGCTFERPSTWKVETGLKMCLTFDKHFSVCYHRTLTASVKPVGVELLVNPPYLFLCLTGYLALAGTRVSAF